MNDEVTIRFFGGPFDLRVQTGPPNPPGGFKDVVTLTDRDGNEFSYRRQDDVDGDVVYLALDSRVRGWANEDTDMHLL